MCFADCQSKRSLIQYLGNFNVEQKMFLKPRCSLCLIAQSKLIPYPVTIRQPCSAHLAMDELDIPDAMTLAPIPSSSTPAPNPHDAAVGTSAGIIGAVLLVAVFVIIFVVRRNARKRRQSSASDVPSVTSGEAAAEMGQVERVIRQRSQEAGTAALGHWTGLDPVLKQLLESCLLDDSKLELEGQLGKGNDGATLTGLSVWTQGVGNIVGACGCQRAGC